VLRIRDVYPKTARKEKDEKKFVVKPFFCSHKFHKIENYFYFLNAEEKNLGQFSKNYRTFYPKVCHKALKNMGLNTGSEIQDPEKKPIPDPESESRVKKAPEPGSATLEVTKHASSRFGLKRCQCATGATSTWAA
jgi:hypothetical protein